MVTLPRQFVATKFPGYFYNVETRTVFSLKSGVLKEMVYTRATKWSNYIEGYRVSVNGHRRWLTKYYLTTFDYRDSVIPMYVEGKTYEDAK